MDKEKNNALESQVEQEFQEHVHKELKGCFHALSEYELKTLKEAAHNKVKDIIFGEKEHSNSLRKECENIFNEPILPVQKFCSLFFFMKIQEGGVQEPLRVSNYPHISALSQILFIYGNIELGKIKNYSGDIQGGDELRKAHEKYQLYVQAYGDPILNDALKTDIFCTLLAYIVNVINNVRCRINPREIIEYLYISPTGKAFLPHTLLEYFEHEKMSGMFVMSKDTNRSGSKINPEKHERTKQACQKAWEKVQKNKILDVNIEIFSEIASSFLKQGESLITTVSRDFYKKQVSQEYKAGAGRKSK